MGVPIVFYQYDENIKIRVTGDCTENEACLLPHSGQSGQFISVISIILTG